MFKGWFTGQTGATNGVGWENLPGGVAVIVSVFFLFVMACAEGLQVSALALQRTPSSRFRESNPKAYRVLMLLGGSDGVDYHGRNMKAFLVGRQFFVACMVVLLGKVTGYAGSKGKLVGNGGEDWGMGEVFNEWCLQTGFFGAVFVVNVAQLASQVAASIFPLELIDNWVMYAALQVMLWTEASGICNACYPLMWFLDWFFGMEKDPFHGGVNDGRVVRVPEPRPEIMHRQGSLYGHQGADEAKVTVNSDEQISTEKISDQRL